MARPKNKTAATSLKMNPEVRDLWEQCAEREHRSLTNLFELLIREHAKKLGIASKPPQITSPPDATVDPPPRKSKP